ncbi:SGNH/GDSL hydrolase family protein [Aspergillus saccharolyticus JOP 1030-1]|uniref:Putative GDSL-like lipase/acylhydrolase n=1 Tax=Aspergillus saccharolyticus JOP 1030-1 TaxID=1450539 RepID=A0A318ZZP8_9EURO|nr:putative GDSL-like lipase/acylhydrolase [Aspergillus saccharolyticus JOP 1030-1]PYH49690.1 putative GDSL-like lipase/acylhydrolase [Aspergillus saccharolyticus JOP 1030-1]
MSKSLSILCFGNSLTAGYYNWGQDYHPYAWKLEKRLKAAFPTHILRIDVDGLPGDLVKSPPGRFLPRLQQKCAATSYDWVIILGGTNDLGSMYPPEKILPALKEAWATAIKSGANVLALTIPECGARLQRLIDARAELNSQILKHDADSFYAFDLHKEIPYLNATKETKARIWDDAVHMKPDGYDLVGNLIADHLIQLLS